MRRTWFMKRGRTESGDKEKIKSDKGEKEGVYLPSPQDLTLYLPQRRGNPFSRATAKYIIADDPH